ncbi:MAG: hypothetical protein AABX01_07865 [Candidatus Micrarchaeota archaeon]
MRLNANLTIKIVDNFDEFKRAVIGKTGVEESGKTMLYVEQNKMGALFSEERIRLLRAINSHPEDGAVKLAGLLGRKQEAVSRDLAVLRGLGIITDGMPINIPSKKPFSLNILF